MENARTLPATIRATVHEDAIGRVTRFFNATVTETLNELFQNARRSGATRIEVCIDDGRVSVADDGAGIADPAALLAFGRSGWDHETKRREDPAGMGIYSLARQKDVTIRSQPEPADDAGPIPQGWRVRLARAHFLGEEAAAVEPMDPTPPGTEVSFGNARASASDVQNAARHFPLPVFLRQNGKVDEMHREDFLKDAVRTEDWRGIRIGVFRTPTDWHRAEVNFHGVVLRNVRLPQVEGIDSTWHARADVVDCPHLELVLPARKEVVETPFMNQLRTACRAAVYRAMLADDRPVDVSSAVRADALALGVELSVARAMLQPWQATIADEHSWRNETPARRTVGADAIVVDADIPVCDQQSLKRAAEQAGISHRLYEADRRFDGYEWYDRLTKATAVTTAFTHAGEAYSVEGLRRAGNAPESCRPDTIMITLHTVARDGERKGVDLPTDVAFGDEDHCSGDGEEPSLLVSAGSEITPEGLADLTMDAYFSASDDVEADSYDTQKEDYEQTAQSAALALLASEDEAIRSGIVNSVYRSVLPRVPMNSEVTIRIGPGPGRKIHIDMDSAPPPHGGPDAPKGQDAATA